MVGRSSRMPQIPATLENYFGEGTHLYKLAKAVIIGASLIASALGNLYGTQLKGKAREKDKKSVRYFEPKSKYHFLRMKEVFEEFYQGYKKPAPKLLALKYG